MQRVPEKVRDVPGRPVDRTHLVDRLFFGFGALAAGWLAWDLVRASFTASWWGLLQPPGVGSWCWRAPSSSRSSPPTSCPMPPTSS